MVFQRVARRLESRLAVKPREGNRFDRRDSEAAAWGGRQTLEADCFTIPERLLGNSLTVNQIQERVRSLSISLSLSLALSLSHSHTLSLSPSLSPSLSLSLPRALFTGGLGFAGVCLGSASET